MTEQYVVEIPSDETLNARVNGLTFTEFKTLTDEQVRDVAKEMHDRHDEVLRAQVADPEWMSGQKPSSQGSWDNLAETFQFTQFSSWRRHGVPDRNVSREDLRGYMSDLVAARKQADPNYGKLQPEQYEDLPETVDRAIEGVFDYFYHMRAPFEYPYIDVYSLGSTLGIEAPVVAELTNRNVLREIGNQAMVGVTYILAEPYQSHWFVRAVEAWNQSVDAE
jgi:hypothetical protein